MKNTHKTILNFIILLAILILGSILLWDPIVNVVKNPEETRQTIQEFGIYGPLIFIGITILQVIFAPIPGQLAGVVGGFLFGIILGTIYALIGIGVGAFLVFFISRKLGRPFVEKVVNKKTLNKFDKKIQKGGIPVLFIIFLLPFFPDDLICYIAGLTKIKIRYLVAMSVFARIPSHLLYSSIGAGMSLTNPTFYLLLGIVALIFGILYLRRKSIENYLFNKFKKK